MKILSQRNPYWGSKKLGASSLTLAKFGCTTTCLSMLSDYFNCFMKPDEIAGHQDWYTRPGNPVGEGLVIWTKLGFRLMKFTWREYGRNDAEIQRALKDPDRAVMFQVNNGAHWVVGIRKTLFGNSYIVADPWDATKCDVIKKYHNITGMAFFARIK